MHDCVQVEQGWSLARHAEIVGGRGIDVQLRRHAGTLQGQIGNHAVFRAADDVVAAVREKDRGRPGGDVQPGREFLLVLHLQIARIAEHGEVGPATCFIDGVDRRVCPLLETCGRGQRKMAACRKADDADPFRVDSPLSGLAPYQADGALSIQQRASGRLGFHLVGLPRHAVLEDDAGDALRIQPGGDLLAFQLPEEVPIAAAGADQHCRSGLLVFRRPIDRDGRLADVGHHPRRLGDLDLLVVQLR